jgi:tryptophanyl-tRNA synthetase
MSLTDPTSKMSKSKGEKNYIALSDDGKTIRKKIMGAVTDTAPNGKMSPGLENLFTLLKAFSRSQKIYEDMKISYDEGTLQYSDLKHTLADEIIAALAPIQEKRRELEARPEIVGEILSDGTRVAQNLAHETLKEVREKTGLL